jgi:beta-barrel assembly-enhancing protease
LRYFKLSKAVFEGRWNDGAQAQSTAVSVAFEDGGLSIRGPGGEEIAFWKYGELTPAAPVSKASDDILLHYSATAHATLFVRGLGVGRLFLAHAPGKSQTSQRIKIVRYSLVATAVVIAAGLFLFFGRFSASRAVADLIPYGAADRIGAQSIGMFGPIAPACENHPGNAALQRILDRLQAGADYGRPFKLHVARARMANAFALPGRHIVLLSGLVKQAKNPEEVAGVLAHEMGHGLEKDPEALFVRNVGMQTLTQLLTGQSGGQSAVTLGAILLQLRYSRAAERSADNHAVEILRKARVGPKPTGEFFLRNAATTSEGESALNYLSTHPSSKERAQLFLTQPVYPGVPLLSDQDWSDAQAICGEDAPGKPKEDPKKQDKSKTRKA